MLFPKVITKHRQQQNFPYILPPTAASIQGASEYERPFSSSYWCHLNQWPSHVSYGSGRFHTAVSRWNFPRSEWNFLAFSFPLQLSTKCCSLVLGGSEEWHDGSLPEEWGTGGNCQFSLDVSFQTSPERVDQNKTKSYQGLIREISVQTWRKPQFCRKVWNLFLKKNTLGN